MTAPDAFPDTTDSYRARAAARLADIPPEKWPVKIARTVLGVVIAAFGVACGMGWMFATKDHEPRLPVLVAFFTVAAGMLTASGELLLHPARLGVAILRDYLSAWRPSPPAA